MIKVRFFGRFVDQYGDTLEVQGGRMTVGDLVSAMKIEGVYLVAVNGEMATLDRSVKDGDEVAIMPKVGGG